MSGVCTVLSGTIIIILSIARSLTIPSIVSLRKSTLLSHEPLYLLYKLSSTQSAGCKLPLIASTWSTRRELATSIVTAKLCGGSTNTSTTGVLLTQTIPTLVKTTSSTLLLSPRLVGGTVVIPGSFYQPVIPTTSITPSKFLICVLVGRCRSCTTEPTTILYGKTTKRIKQPRKVTRTLLIRTPSPTTAICLEPTRTITLTISTPTETTIPLTTRSLKLSTSLVP